VIGTLSHLVVLQLIDESGLTNQVSASLQDNPSPTEVGISNFRPNIVVQGVDGPHAEDSWRDISVQGLGGSCLHFAVTGPCARCSMINVNSKTGAIDGNALQTLAKYRRGKGYNASGNTSSDGDSGPSATTANSRAINFGQFLSYDHQKELSNLNSEGQLEGGQEVTRIVQGHFCRRLVLEVGNLVRPNF
jgi:hypothetical protein